MEIDDWCVQAGRPRGATLTLAQTWALAQAWYRERMSPTYRGRSPQQAQQLFAALGLVGPFWQLP